jgi:hypothetical protein
VNNFLGNHPKASPFPEHLVEEDVPSPSDNNPKMLLSITIANPNHINKNVRKDAHINNNLVRNQLPLLHELLGPLPILSASGDFRPQ